MANEALPREWFTRVDNQDDAFFYNLPRKVVHIDEGAIAALGQFLRRSLPPAGKYLDLMSSWRSHLPADLHPSAVVGLGMNGAEMADNPQLDRFVLQDLNQQPQLPFADAEFDAAICTVSVQYLTKPVEVFRAVHRVLKPGAPFIVSFSNRCFPSKAVAIWQMSNDAQHVQLVGHYFTTAGGWQEPQAWSSQTTSTDAHSHPQRTSDPLFIVWALKETA